MGKYGTNFPIMTIDFAITHLYSERHLGDDMPLSHEILKRIKAKEAEIERLEDRLTEIRVDIKAAMAYIQGLRDILPKVAREEASAGDDDPVQTDMRPGSAPDRVRALLMERGTPLHITAILSALGREHTKANRVSLAGTLARFVRDQRVFSRTAPNTFGLIGMTEAEAQETEELPDGFGK